MRTSRLEPFRKSLCLGGAILGGASLAMAQDSAGLEKLAQQNKELKARLDALEDLVKKEGLMPSGPTNYLKTFSNVEISGFVQASYFHDFSNPPGGTSPGYLWNRKNDNFSLNKVKITLDSGPVERSGEKWDAGYRVSLMFGQDAPILNSGSGITGFDVVREAFVDVNVPIGTGLDVRVGELISLLNYESGDGGAANANFSQGYQWFFTGNGPAAGIQLGYNFTDWIDLKVRVQNGLYAGPVDNNQSKTLVAALGLKPTSKLWFSLIGFGGREDAGFTQSLWGGSLLGGWQATEQLSFGTELDYFSFHNPSGGGNPPGNSPVWSTGLWTTYDFTKQVGVALRAEFLSDSHGVDASGGALGFPNPAGTGQDLSSVALTLNIRPVPNIKIQPEVRFDHSSYSTAFGKHGDRVVAGAGISYLF